jgi:NitT/TauT family transport system ATP-binding protein
MTDRVVVLGLPPTGIHREVVIDLPRPRDRLRTRASPRFAHYGEVLMRAIQEVMDAGSAGHKPMQVQKGSLR